MRMAMMSYDNIMAMVVAYHISFIFFAGLKTIPALISAFRQNEKDKEVQPAAVIFISTITTNTLHS